MDVVSDLNSCLLACNITVIASAAFPEIGPNPSSILGTARWSLLDGFENLGHVINFVHRPNDDVDVIVHEDVGKNDEVVGLCGFVDSSREEFTDLVVLEIRLAVISRER